MPRIAHISDIHFGPTFNLNMWNRARTEIINFQPDLIIASGDFVDNPSPFGLLAAKAELQKLVNDCPAGWRPELLVVPGNHDLAERGNIWSPRRHWFNRIFFSDTSIAVQTIEDALPITLGLNESTLAEYSHRSFRRFDPRISIWRNTTLDSCDGRLQSCSFHSRGGVWPIEGASKGIAFACFDSNPRRAKFAIGAVEMDQITRLGVWDDTVVQCPKCSRQLARDSHAVSLRVAVLHHHPLPIAVHEEAQNQRRRHATLEPFLALANGGDLLHRLQYDRFDLALHGHKHKPQVSRFEFETADLDRSALVVLAAGSCANDDEASSSNILRLLSTEPSGRLHIKTVMCEGGAETERYVEPIEATKLRAFRAAMDYTKLCSDEMDWDVKIDEVGNLHTTTSHIGLCVLRHGTALAAVPFLQVVPEYGLKFEERAQLVDDCSDLARIVWIDQSGADHPTFESIPRDAVNAFCSIKLHQPLAPEAPKCSPLRVECPVSNSIAMSQWELDQIVEMRQESKRDSEYLTRYISHPIRKLTIRLTVPDVMRCFTPTVACLRHPDYPKFPQTLRSPQDFAGLTSASFIKDVALSEAEAKGLSYIAEKGQWILEVERPLPGHKYELRWQLPKDCADEQTIGLTNDCQRMLLNLGRRLRSNAPAVEDSDCLTEFQKLVKAALEHFKGGYPAQERQEAHLLVYESEHCRLVPVLSLPYNPAHREEDFHVPLGGGVSGAAFVWRKVVTWSDRFDENTLIKPVRFPGMSARHILALPIFHLSSEASLSGQLDFRPGAVIGVLALSSDADSSGLAKCGVRTKEGQHASRQAQVIAQSIVVKLLTKLLGTNDETNG